MAGATIMAITYGHQVTSADDEFVALAEAVREHAEKTPGSNLVDVIPICEFLLQNLFRTPLILCSEIPSILVSRSTVSTRRGDHAPLIYGYAPGPV